MGFDPYVEWLQVTTAQRPPNHYELLGLRKYEDNLDVIRASANERTGKVRIHRNGPENEHAVRLLADLFRASQCLTHQERKQAYDQQLRQMASGSAARPKPSAPQPKVEIEELPPLEPVNSDGLEALLNESPRLAAPHPALASRPLLSTSPLIAGRMAASERENLLRGQDEESRRVRVYLIVGCIGLALGLIPLLALWAGGQLGKKDTEQLSQESPIPSPADAASPPPNRKPDSRAKPAPLPDPQEPDARNDEPEANPRPDLAPDDYFGWLPDEVTLPALTDAQARGIPQTVGALNLPLAGSKGLQLILIDGNTNLAFQSGVQLFQAEGIPEWFLSMHPFGREDLLAKPIAWFKCRLGELSFEWISEAPKQIDKEYQNLALELKFGDATKRVVLKITESKLPIPVAAQPGANDPLANNPVPLGPPTPLSNQQEQQTATLGLPLTIDLPRLEEAARPLLVGKLPLAALDKVDLTLQDMLRSSPARWSLAMSPRAGAKSTWQVALLPGKNTREVLDDKPELVAVPIAEFQLDLEGNLQFEWLAAARNHSMAEELRNCVLEVSQEGVMQPIRLRVPKRITPQVLLLNEDRIDLPLGGIGLPEVELLKLEVIPLNGFPPTSKVLAAGAEKKSDPLRIVLRSEAPSIELKLRPFENSKGHAVRMELMALDMNEEIPFTMSRLAAMRTSLAEQIPKDTNALAGLQAKYSNLQSQFAQARGIANARQRNVQCTAINTAIGKVQRQAAAVQKRLAVSQRRQSSLPLFESIAAQLHQQATLKLRVYSLAGQYQVDVLRAE